VFSNRLFTAANIGCFFHCDLFCCTFEPTIYKPEKLLMMKRIIILTSCFLAISFSSFSQKKSKPANAAVSMEKQVRQYWFVMLKKGPNRSQDSVTAAALQDGHMANITKLYKTGKLKVAGPFGDDGGWRGIFIFDCVTKEEVESLLNTDPAVKAGRLSYEIHPWWTSPVGSFKSGKPAGD
jgi:uncharacterized protein